MIVISIKVSDSKWSALNKNNNGCDGKFHQHNYVKLLPQPLRCIRVSEDVSLVLFAIM
jgi:hypothetical protein